MSRVAFSYSVLRYVHDAASGESLNVGVVLFAPTIRFAKAIVQHEYGRLSKAFEGFHGDYYRKVARHLERRVNDLPSEWLAKLPFESMPSNARTLANMVLPDDDSSLRLSEPQGGLTSDPEATLLELFERLVLRNQPQEAREARSRDEVWKTFRNGFAERSVLPKLEPVVITGGSFEYTFEHAWRNAKWHPLEPLSMDAETGETLRDRAIKWVGRATDFQAAEDLGKLYLLVGPPELEVLKVPYGKALALLDKMPIEHEIILEDEAEDFVKQFSALVQAHDSEE